MHCADGVRPADGSYNGFNVTAMRRSLSLFWLGLASAALVAGATLEGTIRDTEGRPAGGASVNLQIKNGGPAQTARTDPAGTYHFAELTAGEYTLRTEMVNGEAATRQVVLTEGEAKKIDLVLEYSFSDEPRFIVAGVTDPSSRGGHGSDTVLRSAEALAKATVSLSEPSPSKAYVAEKKGDALTAVREYQHAAELDPSEPNLFDWGAELLVHRATEPAAEVFERGHHLYPRSARMLLGLAATWYARGDYERATARFFEACDLAPDDPAPYMFLGKVQSLEVVKTPGYTERLARFVKLYPDNAWADYYYAVGLWKQRKAPDDPIADRVRGLLEKAIHLDPNLAAAYLQLGILYADQNQDESAIAAYKEAIRAAPQMDEPHYRLGQVYARTGQKKKAKQELDTYEQMSAKLHQQVERERHEIQQFVYQLRSAGTQ